MKQRFPEVTTVVPGHGAPGSPALLDHTRDLVRAFNAGHTGNWPQHRSLSRFAEALLIDRNQTSVGTRFER